MIIFSASICSQPNASVKLSLGSAAASSIIDHGECKNDLLKPHFLLLDVKDRSFCGRPFGILELHFVSNAMSLPFSTFCALASEIFAASFLKQVAFNQRRYSAIIFI